MRAILPWLISGIVHVGIGGVLAWEGWNVLRMDLPVRRGEPIVVEMIAGEASRTPADEVELQPESDSPQTIEFQPQPTDVSRQAGGRESFSADDSSTASVDRPKTTPDPVAVGELPPTLVRVDIERAEAAAAAPHDDSPAADKPLPRKPPAAPAASAQAPVTIVKNDEAGADVDEPPVPLATNVDPLYPPELAPRRIDARVRLRLRIAADGSVLAATVEKSTGYAAMDRAAIEAVKAWKFQPARRGGVEVESEVKKSFRFVP